MEFTPAKLVPVGIALIFIGVLLVFLGIFLSAFRAGGKTEYGGIVFIGPIPIIFGSNSDMVKIAVIGGIVLMALAVLLMLLPYLLARHVALPPTR
ncbi:TIGR00304 family membrane protein [Hyperthermus butylicus]|uniref:DUF131 domain-containing protein n=1 Tax=Hyperthermus butylicus (strain DSM 5456 / JCM 9403 / PLM1-5) TaxID=415426 RepID=A2BM09_HYPBU|nr:DUF131 domain-containing protein [Hyperthermus butylicus]ABM81020.1 hypothetical protein Hbut_1186 [Hyperthermus butylicus DSM 5456]